MVTYDLPLNEVVFDFYDKAEVDLEGLCLVSTTTSPTTRPATS